MDDKELLRLIHLLQLEVSRCHRMISVYQANQNLMVATLEDKRDRLRLSVEFKTMVDEGGW